MLELRGPWEWQDNPEYPVRDGGTCPTKRYVDGTSVFLCECVPPCEEAMVAKRVAINDYYRNVLQHGEATARDWLDPGDVLHCSGIFLPGAFGKAEMETAAVLLLYYFRQVGVWAPFRPDGFSQWIKDRARERDIKVVDRILSNPLMAPGFVRGFWLLVERGFIAPVVPLREGEDIGRRLVHVSQEFILRCYLSSSGLKTLLLKFFDLFVWIKKELSP